jgi:hypothetical protein
MKINGTKRVTPSPVGITIFKLPITESNNPAKVKRLKMVKTIIAIDVEKNGLGLFL